MLSRLRSNKIISFSFPKKPVQEPGLCQLALGFSLSINEWRDNPIDAKITRLIPDSMAHMSPCSLKLLQPFSRHEGCQSEEVEYGQKQRAEEIEEQN